MKDTNKNMTDFNVTLAKPKADKIDFKTNKYFIQPKLDGVRCYTRLVNGEVKMFSRNHKEFKNAKHIATALKRVFELYPDIILDGELYNHKFHNNFNKIISLVRKQKPTQGDRFESASLLEYHLYDCFDPANPKDGYAQRHSFLNLLNKYGNTGSKVKVVETHAVVSNARIQKYHINNKYNGYEALWYAQMIRMIKKEVVTCRKSKTGPTPRSQSLATLKVKVNSSAGLVNSSVLIQTIE